MPTDASKRKPQGGPPVAAKFSKSNDSSSRAMFTSTVKLWVFGFVCYGIYGKYNGNTDDDQYAVVMQQNSTVFADGSATNITSDSPLYGMAAGSVFKTKGGNDIDWDLVTCLYFAMETVTTVGYGDIVPGNDAAKIITIFVCLIGVMVISQSIGTIANWFVEKNKELAKQAQRKMLENAKKVAAEGDQDDDGNDDGDDAKKDDDDDKKDEPDKAGVQVSGPPQGAVINVSEATTSSEMKPADEPVSPRRVSASGKIIKMKRKGSAVEPQKEDEKAPASATDSSDDNSGNTAIPIKKTATLSASEVFWENMGHRLKVTVVALKCCIPLYIYIGACFLLGHMEGWSGVDSFYFSIITMTTVGFGDVTPVTSGGKLFACFLLPIGLIAITIVGGTMMDEIGKVDSDGDKTIKELLNDLKEVIDQDDDGTVTEEEYLLFCLLQQNRVDEEELDILRQQFQALDADGSGELDEDDVVALTAQCKKLGMN